MSFGHVELQRDPLLAQPVAQPLDGGDYQLCDIRLLDLERHDAGVDGREVEDVVDQRAERVGRGDDVAHVFALLVVQLAEASRSREAPPGR